MKDAFLLVVAIRYALRQSDCYGAYSRGVPRLEKLNLLVLPADLEERIRRKSDGRVRCDRAQ